MSNLVKNNTLENTEKTVSWLKQITDACPHGKYSDFRAAIIFRCGWNTPTSYTNRINGLVKCTLPERVVIGQLAKEFGVPAPSFEETMAEAIESESAPDKKYLAEISELWNSK